MSLQCGPELAATVVLSLPGAGAGREQLPSPAAEPSSGLRPGRG